MRPFYWGGEFVQVDGAGYFAVVHLVVARNGVAHLERNTWKFGKLRGRASETYRVLQPEIPGVDLTPLTTGKS